MCMRTDSKDGGDRNEEVLTIKLAEYPFDK